MTKDALIMLAGALVAIMPFLGIRHEWYPAIFLTLGVLVIALGVVVRRGGGKYENTRTTKSLPFENVRSGEADHEQHQ